MMSARYIREEQPVVPDFDEGHRDYTYKPLEGDQIRLLKLFRGETRSELEASLEIYPLPNNEREGQIVTRPSYEALSYCWGEKEIKNPFNYSIKIIENSESYRIFIRPNLYSALRQLRSAKSHRFLWVDALCINQKVDDDLDEKNEKNMQIPRIHLAYNKAKCVCVWLGVGDDTSDDAMGFVTDVLNLNTFDRFVGSVEKAHSLERFAKLLRRPWFNRRWIVQELAVAREARLYCGSKDVSWGEFAGAVSLFSSPHMNLKKIFKESKHHGFDSDYLGDVRELGVYRLVHAASNFYRKSDAGDILENLVSLEEVVSMLTAFDAKDPRDVVYAVLALSRDATASAKDKSAFTWTNEQVDGAYEDLVSNPNSPVATTTHTTFQGPRRERRLSSDWRDRAIFEKFTSRVRGKYHPDRIITVKYKSPVFDVYKDFLAHTVLHSKSIDIICRPWAADVEGLPSWIPKKSGAIFGFRSNRAYSRIRADLLVGTAGPKGKHYSASQDSTTEWYYRPHDALSQSLAVQGFVLDKIEQKLVPAMGGVIPAEWYKEWQKCQKSSRGSHTMHEDAFWRTLIADRGLQGQKPPPSYYKLACDYAFDNRVNQGYLDTREMMRDCPSIVEEYLQRVQAVTWMRRLVLSRKHQRLGLVPYETKKKDLICILQGCSVPVILRQHNTAHWIEEQLSVLPSENAVTINVQGPESDDGSMGQNDAFGGEGHGGISTSHPGDKDKAAIEEKERERIQKLRRALKDALKDVQDQQFYENQKLPPAQSTRDTSNGGQDRPKSRTSSPGPGAQETNRSNMHYVEPIVSTANVAPRISSFAINNDREDEPSASANRSSQPRSSDHNSGVEIKPNSHSSQTDTSADPNGQSSNGSDNSDSRTSQLPLSTGESVAQGVPSSQTSAAADRGMTEQPSSNGISTQSTQPSSSDSISANPTAAPTASSNIGVGASQFLRPPSPGASDSQQPNGNPVHRPVQPTTTETMRILEQEPQRLQKGDKVLSWKEQTLPKFFYEFIGECYVHGMMDGEAMRFARGSFPGVEPFDPQQGSRQVFWLR